MRTLESGKPTALAVTGVKDKLSIEIVTVTPGMAAAWLDKNIKNRKRSKRFVNNFASDMRARRWRMTADTIKFDRNGNLIDGQHRLAACIAAEQPFQTMVAYGLDPITQNVIDTGKTRSFADMVTLRGMPNANHVAVAYRILVTEKNMDNPALGATHSDVMLAVERHPNLPLYVMNKFPKGISVGAVAYVAYVGATFCNKKQRAQAMLQVLQTGIPDYDGDPIHRLRERIIRSPDDFKGMRSSRSVLLSNGYRWQRKTWQSMVLILSGYERAYAMTTFRKGGIATTAEIIATLRSSLQAKSQETKTLMQEISAKNAQIETLKRELLRSMNRKPRSGSNGVSWRKRGAKVAERVQ